MFKNLPKKKKIILTVLLILIVLLVVVFIATRAFINPTVSTEAITNVNISSCGYFKLDEKSSAINLTESFPMSDNRGMLLDPYTFTLTNSCDTDKGFNIYLVVTTESQIPSNKVKVNLSTEEKSLVTDLPTAVLEENINTQYETKTGKEAKEVYLLKNATLGVDATVEFDFRMWLDYYLAGNEEQNKTYEVSILVADGETSGQVYRNSPLAKPCTGEVLSSCFVNNAALDEALIQHTASITTSAGDNNYRYSGGNDIVQNYVCFGSDDEVCPKENLYRILGIYNIEGENLVKIIKAHPIDKNKDGVYELNNGISDGYHFDFEYGNESYFYRNNKWEEPAYINTYLNNDYYSAIQSKYQNMIKSSKYNIGVSSPALLNPKSFYSYESSTQTINSYNIALMYPSDYFYGASKDNWGSSIDYAHNEEMKENNWMYLPDYNYYEEWTMIPALIDVEVNVVNYEGYISEGIGVMTQSQELYYFVRPVAYLKSNIILLSGNGTDNEPFRIGF